MPRTLIHLLGSGKTNKADSFTKNHLPSHHTSMRHEYLHKANHIFSIVPLLGCINHRLGITSHDMRHEPGGPKSNRQ